MYMVISIATAGVVVVSVQETIFLLHCLYSLASLHQLSCLEIALYSSTEGRKQ